MRRIRLFIIILTVALSILLILFAASLYLAATAQNYYQSSWMSQMLSGMNGMNGMMGNGGNGTNAPSYLWLIPIALIVVAAVSGIGFAFYYAFPEIRGGTTKCTLPGENAAPAFSEMSPANVTEDFASKSQSSVDPFDVVSKTMTLEERKVLEVLKAHDGKYLQKYIRSETGFSRLKTHRIVARFAERGIVTLRQSGNTNEVLLCDWIQGPKT